MANQTNDYLNRLNKAKRKRSFLGGIDRFPILVGAVLLGLILIVIIGQALAKNAGTTEKAPPTETSAAPIPTSAAAKETMPPETAPPETTRSAAEIAAEEEQAKKQAVVDSYRNMGYAKITGSLNVRSSAEVPSVSIKNIIGEMKPGAVCEIVSEVKDQNGNEWYQISSGAITKGYVLKKYIITGDAAKEAAISQVKLMAIITGDAVNIRKSASTSAEKVGKALKNERFDVISQTEEWIQISQGYISSQYCEVRLALPEAQNVDQKAQAVARYDNILVSKATSWLNIRSSPENKGMENVIAKLPGKAAADIIEQTSDGWYKIRSGGITGYVTSDSTLVAVGEEAKYLAQEAASPTAIIFVDALNVRSAPSLDSKVWTQLSKDERYPVLDQTDGGWVQIELDTGDEDADKAFVSSAGEDGKVFVEVRYALTEAIKFSPLEEKANQEMSRRAKIVNYALQFLGNPYVWGGTSLTKGADCSGFTLAVMKNFGISLPHYSGDQAKMGRAVTSSTMRPGDLIFYANSGGTINHVAIYIGNGQIVHASNARSGIKISAWNYRSPKAIRNVID